MGGAKWGGNVGLKMGQKDQDGWGAKQGGEGVGGAKWGGGKGQSA